MITTFPAAGGSLDETAVKGIVQAGLVDGTIRDVNYTIVSTHADLPAADTKAGETYVVKTASGPKSARKKAGLYVSNGTTWVYMGNNVNIDDEATSTENAWSATKIAEVANTKVAKLAASTDNAVVRFDGVTGEVQDSSIILDDAGNIGVGVTPKTWTVFSKILETRNGAFTSRDGQPSTDILNNVYFQDGWKRKFSGYAHRLLMDYSGFYTFSLALSDSANTSAVWVEKLKIPYTGSILANADFTATRLLAYGLGGVTTNTAVGADTLTANTANGNSNTAVGAAALQANTDGYSNTAVGVNAMKANTTGYSNSSYGVNSLKANTTGALNTGIGVNALSANTTGSSSTALGTNAMLNNTTGASNTGVGTAALKVNTTGAGNTALGSSAMVASTTGSNNNAMGMNSLYANTTGSGNIGVGATSLFNNTSGNYNIGIGMFSLKFRQDGTTANDTYSNCIGIGYNTKVGGNNSVAIGHEASAPVGCVAIGTATSRMVVGKTTDDGVNKLQVEGGISIKPLASATPAANGELVFETTSDTSVTIKLKGSDGVVRSAVLTLA